MSPPSEIDIFGDAVGDTPLLSFLEAPEDEAPLCEGFQHLLGEELPPKTSCVPTKPCDHIAGKAYFACDLPHALPATLDELPTAQESTRERVRAKNRRNQKAYRERLKVQRQELQQRLQATQTQLEGAKVRWRHLRLQKQALHQHLKSLETPASPTCSIHQITHCIPASPASPQEQSSNDGKHQQECAGSGQSCAVHSRRGAPGKHHSYAVEEEIRPISSYVHCEPISFAALGKHIAPRELLTGARHFNVIPSAVAAHQAAVAAPLRLAPPDICWFHLMPFPGLELPLSFSASGCSVECHLSAGVSKPALALESSFLLLEHELICSAHNSSLMRSEYCSLDAGSETPPIPPSPPDPAVLARSYARCGVNRRVPLQAASEAILKPLLRKYRALLPLELWRAVCVQAMHSTQTIVGSMQAAPQPSTPTKQSVGGAKHASSTDSEVSDGVMHGEHTPSVLEEMRWEDLSAGALVTAQLLQRALFDVLRESPSERSWMQDDEDAPPDGHKNQGRSLSETQDRLFELNGCAETASFLILQVTPVTARRIVASHFFGHSNNIVQAMRQQAKLYRRLQLQSEQRACLADRWRSWQRRRRALDGQLSSALAQLEEVLSARGIPSHLVQVVECACGAGMVASACMNGISALPKNLEVPELCGGPDATAARRPECMGAEVAGSMHANESHHRSFVDCHVPSTQQGSDGCWPRQFSCEGAGMCSRDLARAESSTPGGSCNERVASDCPAAPPQGACAAISSRAQSLAQPRFEVWGRPRSCIGDQDTAVWGGAHLPSDLIVQLSASVMLGSTAAPDAIAESPKHADEDCDQREHEEEPARYASKQCDAAGASCGADTPVQHAWAECMPTLSHEQSSGLPADNMALQHTQRHRGPLLNSGTSENTGCYQPSMDDCVGQDACGICMAWCRSSEQKLLGESGEVVTGVQRAMQALRDVHTTDELMHFEWLGPFSELTEVQHALMLASAMLDLAQPDVAGLCKAAADHERHDALFGPLHA